MGMSWVVNLLKLKVLHPEQLNEIQQQKASSFKIMGGLGIIARMCVFIL